jgi:hypothetical protein
MGLKVYRLWLWVNLIQPAEPHHSSSSSAKRALCTRPATTPGDNEPRPGDDEDDADTPAPKPAAAALSSSSPSPSLVKSTRSSAAPTSATV